MRTAAPLVCQAFLWGFGEDLFASSPFTRTLDPCIMWPSFNCGTILGQIYQEPLTTKVAHSEYTPPLCVFTSTDPGERRKPEVPAWQEVGDTHRPNLLGDQKRSLAVTYFLPGDSFSL